MLWLAFIAFWIVHGARRQDRRPARVPVFAGVALRAVGVAVALLVAPDLPIPFLFDRFAPVSLELVTLGAALTAAGVAFAVWARVCASPVTGALTSRSSATTSLIVDGPYALVRHPIYTGVLLALFGTALAIGEWRAPGLPSSLAGVAWWRKLTIEEVVMRRQFGDVYDRYAARTRALIPFVL